MITRFVLITLILLNFLSIALNVSIATYLTDKMVYDMDAVRNHHYKELQYYYKQGCLDGTDYPPEFRNSPTGFNVNSPVMYCDRQKDDRNNEFLESASQIGRREQ